jgi:Tol biopolymer transport system component
MARRTFFRTAALAVLSASIAAPLEAQYFGRNKVQYEQFDFRVLETPHFRLHFYPEAEAPARDMARMAERWNTRLSGMFNRRLSKRKPILLYANHPDFHQTNAVMGQLGEGTGGVTESLRDRLIMPLTGVYEDNDHVLGHEMVHVFQYDIANDPKQGGMAGLSNLPLWVVEGVAEYLSLGRADPHTAMWMRDAVIRNKLPTLKQLTNDPRFFPYRYGEALWAYVGGRWGDRAVAETYKSAARFGFDQGIRRTLGVTSDSLGKMWHAATRDAYAGVITTRTRPEQSGTPLIPVREDGESNLSPVISPDGRYIAFFAARDLFGFDLFIADAATGRSVKKLANVSTSAEFDALSFISSAGAWSPDGRKFAFIVYAEGDQQIAILDVESRDVERNIEVPGVGAIQHPAWSPDGRRIAFSGTAGGVSDLFVYDLATRAVRRLTNDRFADIEPSWSPDGRSLVFSTDRGGSTDFDRLSFGSLRLAVADVESSAIRVLNAFPNGKHINPQYSGDGADIFFVSDQSGVSDIYRLTLATGAISQVTNVATGVSGITDLSPAFSVSPTTGRIAFSVFERQGFGIYGLSPEQARGQPLSTRGTSSAGLLPPAEALGNSVVAAYLGDPITGLPPEGTVYAVTPYKPSLGLAYVGQPTVGVAASTSGTMVGGGTSVFFTDMLGNRNLGVGIQANGTLKDIGGELQYQNLGRRLIWGGGLARVPYVAAFAQARPVEVQVPGGTTAGELYELFTQRMFVDQANLLAHYPFSVTRRAELNFSVTRLSFSTEVEELLVVGNQVVERNRFDTTAAEPITYAQATAAFVGDNSFFGFTSPILGWRYRFQVAPTFGSLQFQSALADARRYFFARPVTFAVRGLHFGRYGKDAESRELTPIFAGHPGIVRGYSAETFSPEECSVVATDPGACPEFDRLVGSRLVAAGIELRIPLLGNDRLGLLRSPLFPVELAGFVDGALAWSRGDSPSVEFSTDSFERVPVFSAGASARLNLFGYAVLELFYAKPFQRPDRNWVFGFQLAPGW